MDSILNSIKNMLGLDAEYNAFDTDLVVLINGVLMVLTQLGVGTQGYRIEDQTDSWDDFIGSNADKEAVKTYVFLKVKMAFDPPANATVLKAYEDHCKELEWRLNVRVESEQGG